MQQKFNLEAAGRLLGISSSAMRARAKKNPEKYHLERDNRGQIWVWIDPENLSDLKPAMQGLMQSSKVVSLKVKTDELKAAIEAIQDHAKSSVIAADLQAQIDILRHDLAAAEQRAAIAKAEKYAAVALADERARSLEAAERNLADLRLLLPVPADPVTPRSWWRFWS